MPTCSIFFDNKKFDLKADAQLQVEFSRKPNVLGLPRQYFLREGLINGFFKAAATMNSCGWLMRVEDGYRNCEVQKFAGLAPAVFDAVLRIAIRESGGQTPTVEHMFKRILTLAAQIPKTGTHMSGSALDISVLNASTGLEVDRGAAYLEMSALTPMDSPFIAPAARKNRQEITRIMRGAGFIEYPYEFWHYSSGDAYERILCNQSQPALYGPVAYEPDTGRMQCISNPEHPLNNLDEMKAEIDAAILRIGAA